MLQQLARPQHSINNSLVPKHAHKHRDVAFLIKQEPREFVKVRAKGLQQSSALDWTRDELGESQCCQLLSPVVTTTLES